VSRVVAAVAGTALVLGSGFSGSGGTRPKPPPAAPAALAWPVEGAVVTQRFGCTSVELEPVDPACPGGRFHFGLDLAAPLGTPVCASAAGSVIQLEDTPDGYGLHLVVDSGGGLSELYGHLSEVAVAVGDLVLPGTRIGSVGSTGNSTGPHLHFEVRSNGHPIDPESRLVAITPTGGLS